MIRCTDRKHVIENGQPACDCKALILWPTAARNALVVTLPPGALMPSVTAMYHHPDAPDYANGEVGDYA